MLQVADMISTGYLLHCLLQLCTELDTKVYWYYLVYVFCMVECLEGDVAGNRHDLHLLFAALSASTLHKTKYLSLLVLSSLCPLYDRMSRGRCCR